MLEMKYLALLESSRIAVRRDNDLTDNNPCMSAPKFLRWCDKHMQTGEVKGKVNERWICADCELSYNPKSWQIGVTIVGKHQFGDIHSEGHKAAASNK